MKRSRVFIPPIIRPSVAPVLIARPSTTFTSSLPVIIPELQPPVQIPPVSPMQMPATPRPETVQIPVTLELMTTVFQLLLQIPDPSVQLFLPDPPQPPVQILLPDVTSTTGADSFNRSTCPITTCDRDFGADPYERLFKRSDHHVRI
ncbi:hypothetical protein TNCV_1488621 [Trichonephila clavipes]|nr:hypothetical protein TNCV_1488621 [Trichonephila clavipes]